MRTKTILSILSAFLFVLLISEVLFNYYNNTSKMVDFYLTLSKISSSNPFPYFLQNAIHARLKNNVVIYPDFIYQKDDYKLSSSAINLYMGDENIYIESELSLILYNLSIKSYSLGNIEDFLDLQKKSILLDPDLSFPYVELANFYFSNGDLVNGQKIITKCTSRFYPKEFCLDYQNNHPDNKNYENVGFLDKNINDYFAGLRK